MKLNSILPLLLITNLSIAARTCEDYITDNWPDSRYALETTLGDNVIRDNKTGLMWKQCSEGLSGSDCEIGSSTSHTWGQALELANTTNYAGYSDWKIPNIKELRTITTKNCYQPSINETSFPNTPITWFWTSSPFAGFNDSVWTIYFYEGDGYGVSRDDDYSVRLVRINE